MHARHYAAPSWLRAPAFAPGLRGDVRFVPHRDQFVRLYDPTNQQFVQLYRLECHIAQLMNGARGLDELTAIAQQFSPSITRAQLEYFVVNLNAVGLLDRMTTPAPLPGEGRAGNDSLEWQSANDQGFMRPPILEQQVRPAPTPPPTPGGAILRVVPPPISPSPLARGTSFTQAAPPVQLSQASVLADFDDDEIPDFDSVLGDQPQTVMDGAAALEDDVEDDVETQSEATAEADAEPAEEQAAEAQAADGEEAAEAAAEEQATDEEAPAEEQAADGEAPAEEAPAEEGMTPEEIAAQEQEALLQQERTRAWHQKTWVRALLALAVITGIAAVIPYPLRVNSECTIIPKERVKVRSELQGVLAEILVDEGQPVKKGDVIARIDDRGLKSDRQKTLAEIEKIEAEIAILKQGRRPEEIQQQSAVLAARKNELAFAGKEASRRAQMVKEGVGSRQAADDASRDYETRRRAVAEAEAQLRLLKAGSRPEEIAAQEAVLKRARAELTFIDERLAMTVVRSPIDGTVLTPRFREHVNEAVEAGGLVCEIGNTSKMRAEIFVSEREVDAITLGMPVTVKVESYPTHPFQGKVDFIAPTVDADGKRVRVVVELDNADGMLKSNMTGYGEVEAGKRSLLNLATRRVVRWIRVRFLI